MRQIVRASLPLGEGIILDPFHGFGIDHSCGGVLGTKKHRSGKE